MILAIYVKDGKGKESIFDKTLPVALTLYNDATFRILNRLLHLFAIATSQAEKVLIFISSLSS